MQVRRVDTSDSPSPEEARRTLERAVERLGRGMVVALTGLIFSIIVVELLRVRRLVQNVGFTELWRDASAFSGIGDLVLLAAFPVLLWIGVPRVLAIGYGSLIRNGRWCAPRCTPGPR
jgi:hypothetical protein